MAGQRTAAEALVELLQAYGIDTVFGIPGVHNLALYRGLQDGTPRHVLPRHEQAAGFMADGYARVSGRPAACFVITGPGVTNIATALGQANSDSLPMLVIATVVERADLGLGRGRLHEIPRQRELCRALAGFAETALVPEVLPELVARAFAGFVAARPRPAVIEVPVDVLVQPVWERWRPVSLPLPPHPDPGQVEAAARLLAAARRPATILGGGALRLGRLALDLVERLGCPVVTTVAAKGLVPESHPLSLGATLPAESTREILARCDRLLVVGSELAETDLWRDLPKVAGRAIRVDIDPDRLADPRLPVDLAVLADSRAFVEALLPRLAEHRPAPDVEPAAVRARAIAEAGGPAELHRAVLAEIRRALPEDAVVFADMTQIAYTGHMAFACERPRRWLHPVGFGTLGWALPAAIGAAFTGMREPAVVLVGDFGFQYSLAELATAVEHALPLVLLLWNNGGLAQIRDDMHRRALRPFATAPFNPDFPALARAMGAEATRVRRLDGVAETVRQALAYRRPVLVELCASDIARSAGLSVGES